MKVFRNFITEKSLKPKIGDKYIIKGNEYEILSVSNKYATLTNKDIKPTKDVSFDELNKIGKMDEKELTKMKEYKGATEGDRKADKVIENDKYYDRIFVYNKDTYEKAEKDMVILVANTWVWKVDYDPKKFTISVRFDK